MIKKPERSRGDVKNMHSGLSLQSSAHLWLNLKHFRPLSSTAPPPLHLSSMTIPTSLLQCKNEMRTINKFQTYLHTRRWDNAEARRSAFDRTAVCSNGENQKKTIEEHIKILNIKRTTDLGMRSKMWSEMWSERSVIQTPRGSFWVVSPWILKPNTPCKALDEIYQFYKSPQN